MPDGVRRGVRGAAVALFASWALACGGASRPAASTRGAACGPEHLDACERSIDAALREDRPVRPLVERYAAARSARDPEDGWSALWRGAAAHRPMANAPSGSVLLCEGVAPRLAAGAAIPVACAPRLPKPTAIGDETLALAIADAAGYAHGFFVRGARVSEIFPTDPLRPFTAGLSAIVRDDSALRHAADDVALAAGVRRAIDAAGAARYEDAAREVDALVAATAKRDPNAEPTLRARYAVQLLAAAAIALDPEGRGADDPLAPGSPPRAAATGAEDTPYGDFLRVRTAADERGEWLARRARVLAVLAPDRRAALDEALAGAGAACGHAPAIAIERAGDLAFGWQLARAFGHGGASDADALAAADWYRRYDAMVRTVDASRTGWAYAPMLLAERGALPGFDVAASPTYRRVNAIAERHLGALRALQHAHPTRFRAFAALPLVYSAGVLSDEALREQIAQLTEATVQDKLSRAADPAATVDAVLTGALAGLSYPGPVQSAYFSALHAAFTAKLKGDLSRSTGFAAAALYGADLVYRLATDPTSDTSFSTAQITRALEKDPDVAKSPLGGLAATTARYLALGLAGGLDAESRERGADRRAARDALRAAIARLGDPSDPPPPKEALDAVTSLADGLVAEIALRIAETRKPATASSCPKRASTGASVKRAIAALGVQRNRLLVDPRYRDVGGVWGRRTKLLVTLLSDAIDVQSAPRERVTFAIASADARRAVEDALREGVTSDVADAIAGTHALVRGYYEAKSPADLLTAHGQDARRALGGLLALARGQGERSSGGVALLDALSAMRVGGADTTRDASSLLVSYASAFYDRKLADQGDLWLLGFVATSGATQTPPPPAAIELAARTKSRVEWPLRFLADVASAKQGASPNPASYEASMRRALEAPCNGARTDDVLSVMGAIRDFAGGRRREARAALDALLAHAEERGLSVPTLTYTYEEKTATKVLSVKLGVSAGAGLLDGASSFSLGFGVRSPGKPEGTLRVALEPADDPHAAEQTARYYIHAAALAAAYAFLDGDAAAATNAASRAIAAIASGAHLGALRATHNSVAWASDARAVLALDAELAAEAKMPFLAGDLWTIVRGALAKDGDDAARTLLHPPPLELAAVSGIGPLVERTDRALRTLAASLPCAGEKVDVARYEAPSCDAYPLALSLRIADAMKKLPRLRSDPGHAACGSVTELDGFLGGLDKGTYDPDQMSKLVAAMRAEQHDYDAAVILTRHRRQAHCTPTIVTHARALGRARALDPSLRADLLTVALNCSAGSLDSPVVDDIVELDEATRALPDPTRNLHVLLAITDLAQRAERWDVVSKLADRPAFVDRWMGVSAAYATAALAIEYAASALGGHTLDPKRTNERFALLCETLPPAQGAPLCEGMRALRGGAGASQPQRLAAARELLKRVVATAPAAPRKP